MSETVLAKLLITQNGEEQLGGKRVHRPNNCQVEGSHGVARAQPALWEANGAANYVRSLSEVRLGHDDVTCRDALFRFKDTSKSLQSTLRISSFARD